MQQLEQLWSIEEEVFHYGIAEYQSHYLEFNNGHVDGWCKVFEPGTDSRLNPFEEERDDIIPIAPPIAKGWMSDWKKLKPRSRSRGANKSHTFTW